MKRRRLLTFAGLVLVVLVAAPLFIILRELRHGGVIDDRVNVDLEHVIACGIRSNASYHDPDQIRREVAGEVLIGEFPDSGLRIFIAVDEGSGVQWVVVRGTANLSNIYADLELLEKTDHELAIRIHRGFDEALQECLPWVVERVERDRPVVLTGHSLGGAVAALLLAVLDRRGFEDVSAVTFGQPKVTDRHGADSYAHLDLLRIIHEEDPVPLVPPAGLTGGLQPDDYHHFGAEVILRPSGHFHYLADHDFERLDVVDFWTGLAHIRPLSHDMIKGYLPALKAAGSLLGKRRPAHPAD